MKTHFPRKNFKAVTVHYIYEMFSTAFVKPSIEILGNREGALIDGIYKLENEDGTSSYFAVVETYSGVMHTVELSQWKWYQAAWSF